LFVWHLDDNECGVTPFNPKTYLFSFILFLYTSKVARSYLLNDRTANHFGFPESSFLWFADSLFNSFFNSLSLLYFI